MCVGVSGCGVCAHVVCVHMWCVCTCGVCAHVWSVGVLCVKVGWLVRVVCGRCVGGVGVAGIGWY